MVGEGVEDKGGKRKREPDSKNGTSNGMINNGGYEPPSSDSDSDWDKDMEKMDGFKMDLSGLGCLLQPKKQRVVGPRAQSFLEVEEVEPDMTLSEDDKEAWPLVRKMKAKVVGVLGPTVYFDDC